MGPVTAKTSTVPEQRQTAAITNRQNSRLLRRGRVTLPLSAGRGYAEPRLCTATSIATTRSLVSDCAASRGLAARAPAAMQGLAVRKLVEV